MKPKTIMTVELVLENAESIIFLQDDIGMFEVSKLGRKIKRFTMDNIQDTYTAQEVHMQIRSIANTKNSYTYETNEEKLPFQRILESNDITQVILWYEDKTVDTFYIEWLSGSEHMNPKQTSKINESTGDLYLSISDKTTVLQYFGEATSMKEQHPIWKKIFRFEDEE